MLEERRLDPKRPSSGSYQRASDWRVSTTDPHATPMRVGDGTRLGYHGHYVVDGGKARIVLAALVTPSDVMENQAMVDLLWRVRFRRKLRPHQVTGDGTLENFVAIEDQGIRAYVPLPDFDRRTPYYGLRRFRLRGLANVNIEGLLVAAGQNLKRLLSRAGWGRRPWPNGAAGLALPAPAAAPVAVR